MMKLTKHCLFVALLVCGTAQAGNEIIGTVEFTIDGEDQTWYVLESADDTLSSALWLAMGPERAVLSVTAFNDPDIQLVRHEQTGSAIPDGQASALVVSIAFAVGASEQRYTLPVGAEDGPAVVMLLNEWSNPIDGWTLNDGPGEIHLTSISTSDSGPSAFSGTFSGALKNGEGDTRTIEAGRFDFEKVAWFDRF